MHQCHLTCSTWDNIFFSWSPSSHTPHALTPLLSPSAHKYTFHHHSLPCTKQWIFHTHHQLPSFSIVLLEPRITYLLWLILTLYKIDKKYHHWHGTAYGVPLVPKGVGIPGENYPDWNKLICPYHHWLIQSGDPTWDEVGGHVGITCIHQLPGVEKPIHIRWCLHICVFEPCEYFIKYHTAHVLI